MDQESRCFRYQHPGPSLGHGRGLHRQEIDFLLRQYDWRWYALAGGSEAVAGAPRG